MACVLAVMVAPARRELARKVARAWGNEGEKPSLYQ